MLTEYSTRPAPFNKTRSDNSNEFVMAALTAALQIACDAAVFSNRFEIDEREPLSRIQALAELLVEGVNSLSNRGLPRDEEADVKIEAIAIIDKVCDRIHACIR